ncbi:phosphoribosylglycinamide formyltransferase [Candidatus Poriferisocius sp.]|uniref:phosphoribosylglycinamide formyltransferase n=1 Tax=Candidatus Poriferisocius sp. TaxID=3101276 RepID=UPI003B0193BE
MRLAVLASGSGTILDAMAAGGLPISLVLVDRPCQAEEVAAGHGLPCELVQRLSFGADFDRAGYSRRVAERLQAAGIELVAMAGFGTVLEQPVFDAYAGRILNTHPSLLPAFPGWHAVADALEYGVKVTGCTVHVATLEPDAGPILSQRPVEVKPDDTEATLHERIKAVERHMYICTIREVLDRGRVL